MKRAITYLDLFSGLGASAKGLVDAGFILKNHYFSEVDKYAIANYKYNFKNSTYVGKVQEVKQQKIHRPDIITFGSPCQDISQAGTKKGLRGSRSRLFFDAIRIIDRFRPEVFVFENVKALLYSNESKDFEVVLRAIANLGVYECQWQLVNTGWFLPQNRERIFLVGSLTGKRPQKVFPLFEGFEEFKENTQKVKVIAKTNDGQSGRVYDSQGWAPTLVAAGGYGNGHVKVGNRYRNLTPIECERLQGLPDNWTKYGLFESEIKELSDTQRYILLGNAITSTVMKMIGKRLLKSGLGGIQSDQETIDLYNQLKSFKHE